MMDQVMKRLIRYAVILCVVLWFLASYLPPDRLSQTQQALKNPGLGLLGPMPKTPKALDSIPGSMVPKPNLRKPSRSGPLTIRKQGKAILMAFADDRLKAPLKAIATLYNQSQSSSWVVFQFDHSKRLRKHLESGRYADICLLENSLPSSSDSRLDLSHHRGLVENKVRYTAAVPQKTQHPEESLGFFQFLFTPSSQSTFAAHHFRGTSP